MPGSYGWTCPKCRFEHQFPGKRCVRCYALKDGATREQIKNFVLGIKETKDDDPSSIPERSDLTREEIHVGGTRDSDYVDLNDVNDDDIMIIESFTIPPEAHPTLVQPTTTSRTGDDVSSYQLSKENQRQSKTIIYSRPADEDDTLHRKRPPMIAVPCQEGSRNPYVKKSVPNKTPPNVASGFTTTTTTTASSGPPLLSQTMGLPTPRTTVPPGRTTTGALLTSAASTTQSTGSSSDSWQHMSTVTAQASAIHPPAPSRQTPIPAMPIGGTTGQSRHSLVEQPHVMALKPPNAWEKLMNAQQQQQQHFMKTSNTILAPTASTKKSTLLRRKSSAFVERRPRYSPGPVPFDPSTIHNWIYPQSSTYPARQYQHEITDTAMRHNTLVSLPTGLGKTLIASVVMYNFYRWFPTGKVIFLAPTLPLVNQQVEACYNIMGIPASDTAVLTGKLSRDKRMDHWKSRRVFYCTPQTLQNDLVEPTVTTATTTTTTNDGDVNNDHQPNHHRDDESSNTGSNGNQIASAFASQVVCLILDEAHKATGDYAYVKVIEQLEAAQAKFRIVGLSATPGTTIQAIQNVITTLRSSKLEARDEDDPVVKRYTHDKHMEIVTISKTNVQRDVERRITNILSPHLRQLQELDLIPVKNGNTALNSYDFIKARKLLAARHNGQIPGALLSLCETGRVLAQLRHDAHASLHCLRSKLLPLQNEPQKGLLSNVVKSDEFKQLVQMVNEATNLDATGLSQQKGGLTRNNPKLQKLGEILIEHFKRMAATGKSSRVIVFSQYRDSVAEIVLLLRTLEPMVRPHHFVGQGKQSASSSTKGADTGITGLLRLNGMKQSEQQQVIQEFRDDKYNVLVCTCIGEEGLDIGEVDLIVNYDSVKSPIRMIQRMGRTGRARAGRVIVLLSAGEEQRAYDQSKANATKLKKALQTKRNLIMFPDTPLFPEPPKERLDMTMNVPSQLHMSQVAGGHADRVPRRSSNVGTRNLKYKLDSAQEQERQQRLGNLTILDTKVSIPWRTLRRVFIRHRSTTRRTFGGRTIRILDAIRDATSLETTDENEGVTCKALRVNSAIHEIFPVEKPLEPIIHIETSANPEPVPTLHEDISTTGLGTNNVRLVPLAQNDDHVHQLQQPVTTTPTTTRDNAHQTFFPVERADDAAVLPIAIQPSEASLSRTTTVQAISNYPNLENVQTGEVGQRMTFSEKCIQDETHPDRMKPINLTFRVAEVPIDNYESVESEPQPLFRLPTPPPSSSDEDSSDDVVDDEDGGLESDAGISKDHPHDAKESLRKSEVSNISFCLPTQSSSSEGENSSDDEDEDNQAHSRRLCDNTENAFTATKYNDEALGSTCGENNLTTLYETLAAMNTDDEVDDEPLISLRVARKDVDPPLVSLKKTITSRRSQASTHNRKNSSSLSREGSATVVDEDVSVCEPTDSTALRSLADTESKSTPSPEIGFARKKQKRPFEEELTQHSPFQEHQEFESPLLQQASLDMQHNAGGILCDTPSTSSHRGCLKRDIRFSPTNCSANTTLTDTPLGTKSAPPPGKSSTTADSFYCEICLSSEFLDDDPIILCDGCDLGFHQSCYGINASIESSQPWYCNRCSSRDTKTSDSCMVCGISQGPMKKFGNDWCHPICEPFRDSGSLSQRHCSWCNADGGSRCFSCPASMHPFCAVNAPHDQPWTIVTIVQPIAMEQRKVAALFCPNHGDNANNFVAIHENNDSGAPLPRVRLIQTSEIHSSRKVRVDGPKKLKRKRSQPSDQPQKVQHSIMDEESKRQARLENLKRRRRGAAVFVLEEAEVDSQDVSDENDDEQLENDEMSDDSFINDATQLTQHFSQDNLLGVDPDASEDFSFNHRAVDAQHELAQQYKTPIFNRRMTRLNLSQFSSSSQKGLGNMHFIRSVLEHHRQGGTSEDVENFYRQQEETGMTEQDSTQSSPS